MASSSNKSEKIKVEKENVNERMKNTRKDIETLKADLQKLIQTGSQTKQNLQAESILTLEDGKSKAQELSTVKSLSTESIRKRVTPISFNKPETTKPNTSPDKKRNYNVQEAREYIKKQREKRAEELKLKINLADNNIDIKKNKLRELQETCKELVTKNVQYSRQRSKSREPTPHVRPDRSKSHSRFNEPTGRPDRSRSNPRNNPTISKNKSDRKSPGNGERMLGNRDRGRARTRENVIGKSYGSKETETKILTSEISTKQTKKMSPNRSTEKKIPKSTDKPQSKIDELKSPNSFNKAAYPKDISPVRSIKEQQKHNTNGSPKKNIDYLQVPFPEPSSSYNLDKTIFPPTKDKKKEKRKKQKENATDAFVKDTKETQTKGEDQYVLLKPGDALPYPYNFINTVKWKLQQAVTTTPKENNAAIEKAELTPQNKQSNSESLKDLREKLIKSANSMKLSSSSKKPPNLDFDKVGSLGLINHVVYKPEELVSKRLFDNDDSDGESDTSKNIPEISSESMSDKNSKLELNLEKVKKLNLTKRSASAYSSDFMQESIVKTAESSIPRNSSKDHNENMSKNTSLLKELSTRSTENYKSLLTNSQISKTPAFFLNSVSIGSSHSEMSLKPPPLFLNIAVRPPLSEATSSTHDNDQSNKSCTAKSISTSFEKNTNESQFNNSIPEFLSSSNATKVVESLKHVTEQSKVIEPATNRQEEKRDEPLRESSVSLKSKLSNQELNLGKNFLKNITIRPTASSLSNSNINEIHLKFEAEVRLLNDFNESFKQFVAVEKAFEDIKLKDTDKSKTKILQNIDTQTSLIAKSFNAADGSSKNSISTINFSRGSEISDEEINESVHNNNYNNERSLNLLQNSSFEWNLPEVNDSPATTMLSVAEGDRSGVSISNVENCNSKGCAGVLSLNIFDQLIKDEDARIEHLRTIIKIREQALLDRTKGELVWLEIQRKQLIETGKIESASLIKKKQRGIILKHEQERNEIKKLKQMQKEESEKRKNSLKQQRNIIKSRLSTENMLSEIKVKKLKERRSSGPLKVVQSCSESIHSEVSFSIRSSTIDEVSSVTSRSIRLSEIESELDILSKNKDEEKSKPLPVSNVRSSLFIRETALQKRRKTAEELLQWHRKLLEEEKKIVELEKAATSVIGGSAKQLRKFIGKQPNQLWTEMTGSKEDKYVDDKVYVMPQAAFEQLCKNATQYSHNIKKSKSSDQINEVSAISDSETSSRNEKKITSETNYSSVFESDSVAEEKSKISSIAELIDNFSKIEDEISIINRKSVQDIDELNTKSDSSLVKTDISVDCVKSASSTTKDLKDSVKIVENTELSEEKSDFTNSLPKLAEESKVNEEQLETHPTFSVLSTKSLSTDIHSTSSNKISEILDEIMTPNVVDSNEKTEATETANKESSATNELETSLSEIVEEKSDNEAKESEIINRESSLYSDLQTTLSEILKDKSDLIVDQEESVIILSSDSEKSTPEIAASYSPQLIAEKIKSESTFEIATETTSEVPTKLSDQLEASKSTLIPIEQNEQSQSIANLSLEEAIESASHIEESLSKINEKLSRSSSIESEIKSTETSPQSVSSIGSDKTPQKKIDVKKRVSEILADASPRNDKSPRVQDLYVTTYDVASTAETGDVLDDGPPVSIIFGNEAEQLRRQQLAIEQEIKQLELQQKEQLPFTFMREIPNKPPPPYTPPLPLAPAPPTIVPSDVKEINEIACYSSKVLFKACETKALDKVKFSENGFKLISTIEVPKIRAEFLFNVCKDITRDYYKQFENTEHKPSWLILPKQPTKPKPKESVALEKILSRKLKETFGFAKPHVTESAIIKWGRKKRDHVDEVLVMESLEEESQWTNLDLDQLIVKDRLTDQILNMLLKEECSVFVKTFKKKFRIE